MLRWPGVICRNDAKSCYDGIVHVIAALSSMLCQRASKSAIICVFTTLQNLSHTICTAYGNSADKYVWRLILAGWYQYTALWAVISSPVLDMLREDGFGTIFKLAILTGDTIHFIGFSFVDDTDQIKTARSADDRLCIKQRA